MAPGRAPFDFNVGDQVQISPTQINVRALYGEEIGVVTRCDHPGSEYSIVYVSWPTRSTRNHYAMRLIHAVPPIPGTHTNWETP